MADRIAAIFGTLAIAVVLTTLVLPTHRGPELINSIGSLYKNAALSSEGIVS